MHRWMTQVGIQGLYLFLIHGGSSAPIIDRLILLLFNTVPLDAVMSGVSLIFPKTLTWSNFWITFFRRRPDKPVTDVAAISTVTITTLPVAVKIASWTLFSTAAPDIQVFSYPVRNFFSRSCVERTTSDLFTSHCTPMIATTFLGVRFFSARNGKIVRSKNANVRY